jgi:hypothetical protein
VSVVPFHSQRITPFLGGPEALRNHRDAARHLHDLDHAGYRVGCSGIEGFDRRAKLGRALDECHEHARQHHIQRELRRTVNLCGHVDARCLAADQLELSRILEIHLFGYRQRRGRRTSDPNVAWRLLPAW